MATFHVEWRNSGIQAAPMLIRASKNMLPGWNCCWDHLEWWSGLHRSHPMPWTNMASMKAAQVQKQRHNWWHFMKQNAANRSIDKYPHRLNPGWGRLESMSHSMGVFGMATADCRPEYCHSPLCEHKQCECQSGLVRSHPTPGRSMLCQCKRRLTIPL